MVRYIRYTTTRQPGWGLGKKIVAGVVGVVALSTALALSIALFGFLLVVGTIGLAVFLWKTRALRSQIRQAMRDQEAQSTPRSPDAHASTRQGVVIEGEVVSRQEKNSE